MAESKIAVMADPTSEGSRDMIVVIGNRSGLSTDFAGGRATPSWRVLVAFFSSSRNGLLDLDTTRVSVFAALGALGVVSG